MLFVWVWFVRVRACVRVCVYMRAPDAHLTGCAIQHVSGATTSTLIHSFPTPQSRSVVDSTRIMTGIWAIQWAFNRSDLSNLSHWTPHVFFLGGGGGGGFGPSNSFLDFVTLLCVLCRHVEGLVPQDHHDWYPHRPAVVHLRLCQGIFPSASTSTTWDARVSEEEDGPGLMIPADSHLVVTSQHLYEMCSAISGPKVWKEKNFCSSVQVASLLHSSSHL